MMNKLIYGLYYGLKQILSKFSKYDVAFSTKAFFCVLLTMNFFSLYSAFMYFVFPDEKIILGIENKYLLYLLTGTLYLVVYLFLSGLERKYRAEDMAPALKKKYKNNALLWILVTYFVLLPTMIVVVWIQ